MSDNEIARMSRDIEAYKGAGLRYEQELARKDDAIAEQARQLREALAALERVKRERDAAVYDLTSYHGDCKTCRHMADTSDAACRACSNGKDNNWTWRGPCAENGGTEDE